MLDINKNMSYTCNFDSHLSSLITPVVQNECYIVNIGLVRIKIIKRHDDVIFLTDKGDTMILWGSSVWSLLTILHNDFEVLFTTTNIENICTIYVTFCPCGDSFTNTNIIESIMNNSRVSTLCQRQRIEDLYE